MSQDQGQKDNKDHNDDKDLKDGKDHKRQLQNSIFVNVPVPEPDSLI